MLGYDGSCRDNAGREASGIVAVLSMPLSSGSVLLGVIFLIYYLFSTSVTSQMLSHHLHRVLIGKPMIFLPIIRLADRIVVKLAVRIEL